MNNLIQASIGDAMSWSNIEDEESVKSLNRQDTLNRPLVETPPQRQGSLLPTPPFFRAPNYHAIAGNAFRQQSVLRDEPPAA